MGKLRDAAEQFQQKLKRGKVHDNEFYVVLCSSNNTQFNLSRHLTNTFEKLQFRAGVVSFDKLPNFVLLHQPSELPPSKIEYSFTMNKDFLKSHSTILTKTRLFEVFDNRTVNMNPFVRISEFRIVNRYGPYKEVFDINPKNHNIINHSEIIKSIRKITKIGSHRFSDFQNMVHAVICSKFCAICLEGVLKAIKTEREVEEMISMIQDGVEVPVDIDNAKEGWEWLDDDGIPCRPQMFREAFMDNSWKDRLIEETDSSDNEGSDWNDEAQKRVTKTLTNRRIPSRKSPEKISTTLEISQSQLYFNEDEPLNDPRKKAYQSVLEKLEINLGTLESSRRSKTSRSKFQTMFQTIFSTNEEMNVYAELIDKMPEIIEKGIDKETMKTVIGWLEWRLQKKKVMVKKEEKPRMKSVSAQSPKLKTRARSVNLVKRKIEKRKSYPKSESDCSESSYSPPVQRKKPITKPVQKIQKIVKSKEPMFHDDSQFDSSSDFESFSFKINRNKETKRDSEDVGVPVEIPIPDDVVHEKTCQISPPGSPEPTVERPKSRRSVYFASEPLETPVIPISTPFFRENEERTGSQETPQRSFLDIRRAPVIPIPPIIYVPKPVIEQSTFSQSFSNAPNPPPVIAPQITYPPVINAPTPHIKSSTFSQSSSSVRHPVMYIPPTLPGTKSFANPLRAQSVLPQSVRHLKQAMSDRYLIKATTPTPNSWMLPPPKINLPGSSNSAPFQWKEAKPEPGIIMHGPRKPSSKPIDVITLD